MFVDPDYTSVGEEFGSSCKQTASGSLHGPNTSECFASNHKKIKSTLLLGTSKPSGFSDVSLSSSGVTLPPGMLRKHVFKIVYH